MRHLIHQIIKFGAVGGSAFLIDYGILLLLTEVFLINYLISSAISFLISVIFNYILSVVWVFDVDKKSNMTKNFVVFIVLSVFGLFLNQLFMWLGTDLFQIHYAFTKIIATFLVMIYNFITRKIFLEAKK